MRDTVRLAVVLGALGYPGSARIAAAEVPVYVSSITSPTLCSPRGVALTPGGGLLVGSDCQQNRIEQFDAAGAFVGSWAIPGPRRFDGPPNGVAVDGSGNVFVTDMTNNTIVKCSSSGALIAFWLAAGSMPVDVAVDGVGDVYVAEMANNRIRKTTSSGVFLANFGITGTTPGKFQSVTGVAVDASGRVYGADNSRGRVIRFLANGTFDMEFAPPSPPSDVAVGPDGNIYVTSSDWNDHQAYQYSPGGVFLGSFGSPLVLEVAYRIFIDTAGTIYISEQIPHRVAKFQIEMATPAIHLTLGRLKAMYR